VGNYYSGQLPGKMLLIAQPNKGHHKRASSIMRKIRSIDSMAITIQTQAGMRVLMTGAGAGESPAEGICPANDEDGDGFAWSGSDLAKDWGLTGA
jgi:hypothetical protein